MTASNEKLSELITDALDTVVAEALVGDGVKGVAWFARGAGIARAGPYKTPHAAREAFRLAAPEGVLAEGYPEDFSCWPEPA